MTGNLFYHREYLELCLEEAEKSLNEGRTPVAALLTNNKGDVIAKARSQALSDESDRTSAIIHAELRLIIDNPNVFNNQKISLYTSLEPCLMCMGAIIVSRINLVVWATDDHWGGALKVYDKSREYIKQRLPIFIRTPFPDLQKRGAELWIQHLNRVDHPEYISKILKWQVDIK